MPGTTPTIGTMRPSLDRTAWRQATDKRPPSHQFCEFFMKTPLSRNRPLLFVDVDGVISLFGFPSDDRPNGLWLNAEGMLHLLSSTAGSHLQSLANDFDLVWCTGWEEKANEHLLAALALPAPLPYLVFDDPTVQTPWGHWKLEAVEAHAGDRPLAWIDDSFNEPCHRWAERRPAPTLLVATDPPVGLTEEHVERLRRWAQALDASS